VQGGAASRARKLAVTAKDGLRLVGEVYGEQGMAISWHGRASSSGIDPGDHMER